MLNGQIQFCICQIWPIGVEMLITVTDKGLPEHEYAKTCKCRGCIAVTKAKRRSFLIPVPLVLIAPFMMGFLFGDALGVFTSLALGAIGAGIFIKLSPSSEVLEPDAESAEIKIIQAPADSSRTEVDTPHRGWS